MWDWLPHWFLISRLFNLAILAREYFVGFYFRDFNTQIWKKGIKFRDLSILNFIRFLVKPGKQCVKALQINVISPTEDKKRSLPVISSIHILYMLLLFQVNIFFSVIWIFYLSILKFREDFFFFAWPGSLFSSFFFFFAFAKNAKLRPAKLSSNKVWHEELCRSRTTIPMK